MPAALSLLPVCPHWPPQWVERRQSYLGDALAGQRGLIKPPTYCIRCRKCSKHWDGDKAPCALQAGAGDKPGVMPLLRATTWGGSGSLQIRALLGLYNPRHQLVFLCCHSRLGAVSPCRGGQALHPPGPSLPHLLPSDTVGGGG